MSTSSYDIAVVGAGIIGLATAHAARQRSKRVVVIDREAHAVGASVRNFGFVTVTGQQRGAHWARAKRTRDVWLEVGPKAGVDVLHRGLLVVGRRPEAAEVLAAFLETEMGEGCRLIGADEARAHMPALRAEDAAAILYSPHEARVESKDAVPRLAAWLEESQGVTFLRNTQVHAVDDGRLETSRGTIEAGGVIVCPGDDLKSLFPERLGAAGLKVCTLQMLRVAPQVPTRLGAAVMSDLSLVRYEGYAALPQAGALRGVLDREQADELAAGIHLIAVQSADGSLVVGDSHVYGEAPDPFASERVDNLILGELDRVLDLPGRQVVERWTGTYASADDVILFDRPCDTVRLLVVTGGTGASTAFALGEEVVADLLDS